MKALLPVWMVLSVLPAQAATVVVDVHGVRNDRGHVLVALCTKADFLQPHCRWKGSVPAVPGTVAVTIKDVPPGRYAAQAFHDENDNGTLDRNFFGLPKEAMGFSNNAPMHLGPPRFDTAAFTVGSAPTELNFSLQYFGR
jgi:uncharacterized protein (DUF2141 family)